MSRKCLAIGVGSIEPVDGVADEFPYLDGAVVAAEAIGQWALNSGFAAADVMVLTDKGANRVTDVTLQDAFDKLIPDGTLVDHFVLSFTGHGLTGINDDTTYWLMSDSLSQGYRIFVEDLRRQLYAYGIHHLTIFSDACRAIDNSRSLRDLLARPGVRKRHRPPVKGFQVARFNACQDATSAFMLKVPGAAAPGKCIFSGVLAEALWGRVPAAFEGTIIDSASLGRGLGTAAMERATQYNLTLVPGGSAFFDKVIYFDQASPPLPPDPDLQPWPPAAASQVANAGPGAPSGIFESVLESVVVRNEVLGGSFGVSHPDIDTGTAFLGLPVSAKSLVESVGEIRRRLASPKLPKPRKKELSTRLADELKVLEALAAGEVRRQKAKDLRGSVKRAARPTTRAHRGGAVFGPAARIVVNDPVRQVWSDKPIRLIGRSGKRAAFAPATAPREGLLLIEFVDGLFAPVSLYRDLVCTVLRDDEGVAALSYHHFSGDPIGTSVAATAISRLLTGDLSVGEVDKLATELRYQKHVNPVFGAIAAYCYDVTGDLNSIRRMAAFYGRRHQAAPYDVVFMGMIENNGKKARVAAVPKDDRRQDGKLPSWLTASTSATDVRIAGRCPWLRQGWDFLSSPEDAELPLVDGLDRYRASLTPSVFTTLKADGGKALVEKWRLRPNL